MSKPKVDTVRFVDPYYHINPMDNNNDGTHIVDSHEEQIIEDDEEQKIFDDVNENTIFEE